jgi:hypothetical protein
MFLFKLQGTGLQLVKQNINTKYITFMKKTLVTLAAVAVTVGAFAQGQVQFKNSIAGTPTPYVFLADGTTKVPASIAPNVGAYAVDLYYGAAGISNPNSLTPLGLTVYFSTTASQAGLFSGGSQTIPGITATATLQIRAWETKGGLYTSYAAALQGATGLVGEGNLVQVALSAPPTTPPTMAGITPIVLHQVPEPTVAAIAGLGLASMLILRRKK